MCKGIESAMYQAMQHVRAPNTPAQSQMLQEPNSGEQPSGRFRCLGELELCTKHAVPKATGDAKAILKVGKVVLEVILFQVAVVRWKATTGQ